MTETLPIDGRSLTLEQFLAVVRGGCGVSLDRGAVGAIEASRRIVDRAIASRRPVYGITTGFGALSGTTIPVERARELQLSLVRSHASGAGPPLARDVVRGLVLLRLNSLARGVSGVRLDLAERLIELLNRDLVPWIPEQGSVGASGDLAPLAHLALALIGEGSFLGRGASEAEAARETLAREGLVPLTLLEKEGVAVLNGTSLMGSYLALAVADARELLDAALVASALSFDALRGNPESLDDRIGEMRNSSDQREIARALRALLAQSGLAVRPTEWSGQDPYTLRCLPQVLGAVRMAVGFAETVARSELNAVSDNPLVFEGDEFVHGGAFHGQSLAYALDALAIAVQYLAGFSERRISRLLHPALNRGLPAFLASDPLVGSGLMIPQYLAAALVAENATLVHPASAVSLPTSADQEDYVSMGAWAGAKLHRVMENARRVVDVEWIVAGEALERRRPLAGGRGSEAALRSLRSRVEPWARDRSPSPDIQRVADAIRSGALTREVRAQQAF